jgi:uncharacterized protein involved in exopolysaccharide biosynthesis
MAIGDIYFRRDDRTGDRRTSRVQGGDHAAHPAHLIDILWHRKLIVFGSVAVCLGMGIGYIAVTPPRYLSSTSILIDPRLGKSVGYDPMAPGFVPDNSAMDSQLKLLTSQTVLKRAAKLADLANDPEFDGSRRGLLQRLLHAAPHLDEPVDLRALEKAITIKRPERTYVVSIEVLAEDADKSAEIANDIAKAYIEDQITSRVDAAQTDTTFVRQRLDKLSEEIKQAENKAEAYKIEHNIVDATGLRANEQQVTDLSRSLGDARTKVSDAKAKMKEIDAMARRGRLDASSEALTSVTMERLRQQQAETEQTVAKLAMTLGARHPELLEAESRQAKLAALIRDELQRLKMAAAADYRQAADHERQIESEVDRLKGDSAAMNRNLVPLDQLERNVRVLRASFEKFAQVNDTLSQQEADSPPARVIATASPAVSPASPKKTIVGAISLAAGLFSGLVGALLAESVGESRPRVPQSPFDAPPLSPQRPRPTRRYWDDDDDDPRA